MIRDAAVSGAFYESSAANLERQVKAMLEVAYVDSEVAKGALAFVAPHAGYRYSGAVAAHTYKMLGELCATKKIDTFVIVGPNHTGNGSPISVSAWNWRTPFGVVKNDMEFSEFLGNTAPIDLSDLAHMAEHSVEVQLPFLQKTVKDPHCVFVCMGDQSLGAAGALSEAILNGEKELGRHTVVIASSDFNHYEPADVAKGKDMPAIDAICKLDFVGFYREIEERGNSVCGFGPIAAAGMFAKAHGATSGRLVKYTNSGDVNGDRKSVVTYASIAFTSK